MDRDEAELILRECRAVTDLEWRLAQIPPDAACRGAFLNMLDKRAGQLGHATQSAYRRAFGNQRLPPFRMVPVARYVTQLVALSHVHFGSARAHEGIREIVSETFGMTSFLFGATSRPGMAGALLFAERMWRTLVNYSRMICQPDGPDRWVVSFSNEYVWVESAMRGGLEGLGKFCGLEVETDVKLRSPFDGDVTVWVK